MAVTDVERAFKHQSHRLIDKLETERLLNGRAVCVEMVAICRELQRLATEHPETSEQELARVKAAIEDRIQQSPDKTADPMDDSIARFYCGSTTQEERRVMSRARRASTLVRRENEYIVDWMMEDGGRHAVRLHRA